MAVLLTQATFTQYTAADTCVAYPACATLRLTTNALSLAALQGCGLHVYPEWWVAPGGSPAPPLEGPYLTGGTTYYTAPRSGSYRLDITAAHTTGTWYDVPYAHPADPANEAARRQAAARVQFDVVGGVVVLDVRFYWLNQADQHGTAPQPPQPAPQRLLCPEFSEPTDLGYRPGSHVYYQNGSPQKVLRVQALLVQDLAQNLYSHLTAESAPTALRFWNREPDGSPATGFAQPAFILMRGGTPQTTLSASAPSLLRIRAQGGIAPARVLTGIFRTDAPDPTQFYTHATQLALVDAPLAPLNAHYEALADAFEAPATLPLLVGPGQYEVQVQVRATYPQLGGRYRAFAIWEKPGGQAWAFISDEYAVTPCPPLCPPPARGELATHHATGGDWLHAGVLERVQSRVIFDAAPYDACRPLPLLAALERLHVEVYADEVLNGQLHRHTLAEGVALPLPSGVWDTSGLPGLAIVPNAAANTLTITYAFRLRQDAHLRCLRSRNLTTGVVAPQPLADQDWTGRSLQVAYTLHVRQTSPAVYTETLVKTQRIDVGPLLDAAAVSITDNALTPLTQVCDAHTEPVRLCIDAPADVPADAHLLAVQGPWGLDTRLLAEHDPAPGLLDRLTVPALALLPTQLDGQAACLTLPPQALPAAGDTAQRLCLVLRGQPCLPGALAFAGGPEGSASEFAEAPGSTHLDFAAGPFTVALWVRYTGPLPPSGSVVVSRRPTSGDFWYGWAVGFSATGHLSMTARHGAANLANRQALAPSPADQWQHVAFVFDGPDPVQWRIYTNGAPLALQSPVALGTLASFDAPAGDLPYPLRLGRDTALDTDDYLAGALMGVQLYAIALPDAAVAALAQTAPCTLPTGPGLRAHYPLNETSGSLAADLGPHGLNATLVNYTPARTAPGGGAWEAA